jgi:putative addiction module antidote
MIQQQLRKAGNSYVVTIPKDVVESNGWQEGDLFAVQLTPLEVRPTLRPVLQKIADENWEKYEDVYRYLADR